MHALLLVLLLTQSPVTIQLEWKGGDPISPPETVAEASHDATAGAGDRTSDSPAPASQTAICPCLGYRGRAHCYCLQRGVACKCNRTTGSEWIMADGKPVSKTGRYANPNNAAATPAAPFSPAAATPRPPGADKPSITIIVADFHCPPCNKVKGYDWSGFDVTWQTGGAASYPQISWLDARGVRQILRGAYTPSQVAWSWRRTQE